MDGTLIEAWAGQKNFQKIKRRANDLPEDPGNSTVNFRGEKRSNRTHRSRIDPEFDCSRRAGE